MSIAAIVLSSISLLSSVPSAISSPDILETLKVIASVQLIPHAVFEILIPDPHVIFDVSSTVYVPSHDSCHTS